MADTPTNALVCARNEQCPCGGGRKWKHGHGATPAGR
jgi:hypothetical protein